MIAINIPGGQQLRLEHLVLDLNGTIALDGRLLPEARERMARLAESLQVHVLTADTHGTARAQCAGTGAQVRTFPRGAAESEKLAIVRNLGAESCCCIGNGRNDRAMCQAAALSVAVVGREGVCAALLPCVDVGVTSITDALDLLLEPQRLVATLRW